MNSSDSCDSVAWRPCSPGMLGELSATLSAKRRRHALQRVTVPLGTVALLIVGAWGAISATMSAPVVGEISCQEVRDNLDNYTNGRLSGPANTEIASHLRHCRSCRAAFNSHTRNASQEAGMLPPRYLNSELAAQKFSQEPAFSTVLLAAR